MARFTVVLCLLGCAGPAFGFFQDEDPPVKENRKALDFSQGPPKPKMKHTAMQKRMEGKKKNPLNKANMKVKTKEIQAKFTNKGSLDSLLDLLKPQTDGSKLKLRVLEAQEGSRAQEAVDEEVDVNALMAGEQPTQTDEAPVSGTQQATMNSVLEWHHLLEAAFRNNTAEWRITKENIDRDATRILALGSHAGQQVRIVVRLGAETLQNYLEVQARTQAAYDKVDGYLKGKSDIMETIHSMYPNLVGTTFGQVFHESRRLPVRRMREAQEMLDVSMNADPINVDQIESALQNAVQVITQVSTSYLRANEPRATVQTVNNAVRRMYLSSRRTGVPMRLVQASVPVFRELLSDTMGEFDLWARLGAFAHDPMFGIGYASPSESESESEGESEEEAEEEAEVDTKKVKKE